MKKMEKLALLLLFSFATLLPNSEAYCIEQNNQKHICSNIKSENAATIINIYLDSGRTVKQLVLENNTLPTIDNTIFPNSISYHINYLTISNSGVEFITIGSFEILSRLESLIISNNKLTSFDGVVLKGLSSLKSLYLKGNNIESIENICVEAKNLQQFVIEDNNGVINNIGSNIFKDCKQLKTLKITHSGLKNIDSGIVNGLSNLQTLNFSSNNLENLNFLKSNESLSINVLDISYNKITEIETDLLNPSLQKLQKFILSYNDISVFMSNVDTQFNHNLGVLNLDSNKISVISKDLFKHFQQLSDLNIDNNPVEKFELNTFRGSQIRTLQIKNSLKKITHLKNGMFSGLSRLDTLDLSEINIISIEKDTFQDLKKLNTLYLQNNKITEIYNGTFNGLTNLETFNLSNNPVSLLESGAFFGLKKVKYFQPKRFLNNIKHIQTRHFEGLSYNYLDDLDLSDLRIENVDESAFKGLFGLKNLRLDENRISNLVENTFIGVSYLETLNISRNNLVSIHKNAFVELKNLKSLNLSYNNLTSWHIDTFDIISLRYLYLSNNKLNSIQTGMFKKLHYLQELDLQDNMITHLETHSFIGLTSVYKIHFHGNHIQKIDAGAFIGLDKIAVYFSKELGNLLELETLETDTFIGLTNLEYLDLSNRNVKMIMSKAFRGIRSLTELSLQNNSITLTEPNTFSGTSITDLNLAYSNLSTFGLKVFEDSSITKLNLTGNNLTILNFGVFAPIRYLQELHLYNSSIVNITKSGYYRGNNELKFIDLRHNLIETLASNLFENMSNLETIYLSGNPLHNLPANVFYGLNNLKDMSLTVVDTLNGEIFKYLNSLKKLTIQSSIISEISTIPKMNLTLLNINDNKILKIKTGAFKNLINLLDLIMSNNSIKKIEPRAFDLPKLSTLDLSDNNLTHIPCYTFSGLDNLRNLYLNNNKIDSIIQCTFDSLTHLSKLNLSFNSLRQIQSSGTFSHFEHLDYLDLSHNMLDLISKNELYHIRNVRDLNLSYNKLNTNFVLIQITNPHWDAIDIRYNEWTCDNLLNWFRLLNTSRYTRETNYTKNINGVSCR